MDDESGFLQELEIKSAQSKSEKKSEKKSSKKSEQNKKQAVDSDGERIDTLSEEDNEFRITKINLSFLFVRLLDGVTCLLRQKEEDYRQVYFSYVFLINHFQRDSLFQKYYVMLDLAHSFGVAWVLVIFQEEPLTTLKYFLLFLLGRLIVLFTQSPYTNPSLKKLFMFNYTMLMVITIYHLNIAMQEPDLFVYDLAE